MVGHKFLGGSGWVVASTTLERWLRRRRRGRGTPLHFGIHRNRARWGGACAPGWGYFAAAAASFFLDAQKEAKEAPGVGAEGQNRLRRPCPNVAHPLDPLFTGAAN